jgi:16S rRNA (uracil1498-N3)-methyltransferase
VNLLLVDRAEVRADGTCALDGRRARHLRDVLGVQPGTIVRAGVIDGGVGTAEVIGDDGVIVTVRITVAARAEPVRVELVLAVPRPKVIARAIEIAASFGVRAIELTNAWRVDKSYLASPKLAPAALAAAARVGAEQGMTTRVPEVRVWPRFMALVDARFGAADVETRVVAHPDAPPIESASLAGPIVIAIGPERGWIDRELDTLRARGFQPVSLGAAILRVEAAVAAALAQLALLGRIKQASPSS